MSNPRVQVPLVLRHCLKLRGLLGGPGFQRNNHVCSQHGDGCLYRRQVEMFRKHIHLWVQAF